MEEIPFDITIVTNNFPYLEKYARFEELIYNISSKNIDEIIRFAKEEFSEEEFELVHTYIGVSAQRMPFSFKYSGDVWASLAPVKYKIYWSYDFLNYLCLRGLLDTEQIVNNEYMFSTAEEYESMYKEGTVASIIKNDDLESFTFKSSEPRFEETKITLFDKELSLIEFAAFCGSVKCFKYMFLNISTAEKHSEKISSFAVKGGSLEIIEICAQNELSFSGCLKNAVKYHKNEIAQWIITNYGDKELTLDYCIGSLNTIAIAYGLLNNLDIEELDKMTPMIRCGWTGFYHVAKILVEKGAKIESIEGLGYTSLIYACFNGHANIVRLLCEHGADTEHKNYDGFTPLIMAAYMNHSNCVKVLAEFGANVNAYSSDGISALSFACYNGDIESAKIIIEKGVVEPEKSVLNPLVAAFFSKNIELIRYIQEKLPSLQKFAVTYPRMQMYVSKIDNQDIQKIWDDMNNNQ